MNRFGSAFRGRAVRLLTLTAAGTLAAATFAAPQARDAAGVLMGDDAFRVVSPEWVAERSGERSVKILDVRTSVADYQRGHVPGAICLANNALRLPDGGVPAQYLDPEPMAALFQRVGVNTGDEVIVYADSDDVLGATMVAYALHRIGHRRVALMDGGIEAYRQRFPLTQAYPRVGRGDISPALERSVFIELSELKRKMRQDDVFLLDTRPAEAFFGNTSRWMRNGHIPGAVNLDWHVLVDPTNHHGFKPLEEIRRLIEATGAPRDDEVVVYCGTSREATLVQMVMRHALGYANVRLYEGSWTEYCAQMDLPVAREGRSLSAMAAAAAERPAPTTDTLQPYECGAVARLHTINNIFLASQPSPADFEQAKLGGIRSVINQRHESEEPSFNERDVVTSLGMNYYNPAWNGPDELTAHVLDQTRELLRTVERPALLHCSSANRTGATWLAYSVLDRGLSWDAALEEAKIVGLRSPDYERIVKEYVERRRSGSGSRR